MNAALSAFRRIPWARLFSAGAVLGALGLTWLARETPLYLLPFVRVDGLSGFFLLVTLFGVTLAAWGTPGAVTFTPRPVVVLCAFLAAYSLTWTPGIGLALAALALARWPPGLALRSHAAAPINANIQKPDDGTGKRLLKPGQLHAWFARIGRAGRHVLLTAPLLLAAVCMGLGYGTLALRGVWFYDQPTAGLALDSLTFWFVLLAAVIPLAPLTPHTDEPHASPIMDHSFLVIAWLYPLVRLYSLGPWNTGWSLATLLLGGAMTLWVAVRALGASGPDRTGLVSRGYAALALSGFGLSSGAGIAAGCFALLALALRASRSSHPATLSRWLLSGAVPFTAPFVAIWMFAGAAAAGGVTALAAAGWMAGLLLVLVAVLPGAGPGPARAPVFWSVVLGVAAPVVVLLAVQPAIVQLQGGLTPFGDIVIWPWAAIAVVDSARAEVALLPSVVIASLMLVLAALTLLVVRYLAHRNELPPEAGVEPDRADQTGGNALAGFLQHEVPWLGGAARRSRQEPPGDAE
jgi:hypothetical protein